MRGQVWLINFGVSSDRSSYLIYGTSFSSGVISKLRPRLGHVSKQFDSTRGYPGEGPRRLASADQPPAARPCLHCAMCPHGGRVFQAADARSLMQHLVRAHLGQALTQEGVTQLRLLHR
eukprot:3703658-Amphidinium_carterae.1